jgi:putative ABC transport system permease protein
MDIFGWLDTSFRDIRYALRQFLRNPAFAALAIFSLAIGIGINTAIFSVLNAALYKTLSVRSPNELVVLTDPNASVLLDGLQSGVRSFLSYAEFVQLRDHATSMSGI